MGNSSSSSLLNEHKKPLLEVDGIEMTKRREEFEAVVFQANSFIAVLLPVLWTMCIASVLACTVQDAQTQANMSTYLYFKDIDTDADLSTTQKSVQALVNAIVIIAFIAAITFAVVILYKFNCMKGLVGYLVLSSAILLGVVGNVLVQDIIVLHLGWMIDVFSQTFIMYNFSIVGTISIFYQRGIPSFIEKGYLVATSIIMAWQLCQWPEWSAWTVLCMLAFWDLFAVLTPCGPLKCLVNLMTKEGRPMPGLLYEADVEALHLSKEERSLMSHDSSETNFLIEMTALNDDHIYPAERDQKRLRFQSQIHAFYLDFNPGNAQNSSILADVYLSKPQELWRELYDKYQVKNIPPHRNYPSPSSVFADRGEPRTIKLGLGDFIFYSVLVARAAMHGFETFIACLMCVVVGLGITMYLLTKFNALPALPISIFLAVLMFVFSQYIIVPMLDIWIPSGYLC